MARIRISPEQVRQIRGEDTQVEFARLVGVSSPQPVSRWESGHCRPSPAFARALERLAQARGVDLGNGSVRDA